MELFRTSAASVCLVSIIFAIISNLLPSEKFSKQISVIFSLIFAAVIVTPLLNAEIHITDYDYQTQLSEDYKVTFDSGLNSEIQNNLCTNLYELLSDNGILASKISVDVNNSADGSISITKAEITVANEKDIGFAKKIVRKALGNQTEVNVKSEA